MQEFYTFPISKEPMVLLHSRSRDYRTEGSLAGITHGEALMEINTDKMPLPPKLGLYAILATLGLNNAEIAGALGTTTATVHSQLPKIYERFDLRSRSQVSRHFLEQGYVGVLLAGRPLGLTPAELRVVDGVSRGLTNRQIGKEASITASTVKTHLQRIGERSGWRGREPIVLAALLSGEIGTIVTRAADMYGQLGISTEPYSSLLPDTFSPSQLFETQ